jgi:hypothetical protein
MDTDMLRDESTAPADIPGLVAQARAAYQQNRIKECLALTKAALLVDPGNSAALEIQSAVRFDMQRDLSDARALIEESRNKPEAQKYRKAAEIILLKALYLDPDSEGAKTLLSTIRLASDSPTTTTTSAPAAPVSFVAPVVSAPPPTAKPTPPPAPAPPIVFAPPVVREPAPVFEEPTVRETVQDSPIVFAPPVAHELPISYEPPAAYEPPAVFAESTSRQDTAAFAASASRQDAIVSSNVMQPELSSSEPIPFTVGTSYIEKPGYMKSGKKKGSGSNLTVPLIVVAILVIAAGMLLFRQKQGTVASASTATENTPKIPQQSSSQQSSYTPASSAAVPALNTSSTAGTNQPKTTPVAANTPPALPDVSPANSATAANSNSNSKTNTASAPTTGSLAVSCAIAAEIYQGDKHLGSTPTTLQLPAGNQTLEYRHGDLRAVVTHAIKAKETTTALVVFDAVIQVQARPWATVSIEGSPRMPLGTTPLSDVRLPIGSVLIFENPNFPTKSQKIGPDDKAIQMVFP